MKIYGVVKVGRTGSSLMVVIPKNAVDEMLIKPGDSMVAKPGNGGILYEKQGGES